MGGCCSKKDDYPKELDLSKQNLKKIPAHVFKMVLLNRLILSKNTIEMEENICTIKLTVSLKELRYLDISENQLRLFPKDLPKSLETIIAGNIVINFR